MRSKLINAIIYFVIGYMILLQQDTNGELLIEGWKGLFWTMLLCFAMFVWNMASVCHMVFHEQDAPFDNEFDFDNLHRASKYDDILKPRDVRHIRASQDN
jgi:hypothetical protein